MVGKTMAWMFAAGLALGAGVLASAIMGRVSAPTYRERIIDEIPQASVAEDQGITVEVLGAAFSGTETILRLRITSENPEHGRVMPTPDGFVNRGFAGALLDAMPQPDGQVIVTLPPYSLPSDYVGAVPLEFARMGVQTGQITRVSGSWPLELTGPDPSVAADILRSERLSTVDLVVHGTSVTVSAIRSATETRVDVSHSGDIQFLVTSKLIAGGEVLLALREDPSATGFVAHFPPTSFGSAVSLDLGTVGYLSGPDQTRLTVNVGEAIERADDGAEEFAIDSSDVISGPPTLVITGNRGSYGSPGSTRDWVGLRLDGSWYPVQSDVPGREASPIVYDAAGNRLPLAHVQTGHSQDGTGNVLPGTTDIAVFVTGGQNLDGLRFELGPATASGDRPVIELTPVR